MSPAKAAEPIEMPFGLRARMGPRNHVIDESPEVLSDVTMATNFGTKIAITGFVWTIGTRQQFFTDDEGLSGRPTEYRYRRVCCGQTAEWIKMPLVTEVGLDPGDIVLDGDPAPQKWYSSLAPKGRCHGNHYLAFCV